MARITEEIFSGREGGEGWEEKGSGDTSSEGEGWAELGGSGASN